MADNANEAPDTGGAPTQESTSQEPVVDYGEILAQHQAEIARTGKTVEDLRSELGKSHGALDRVRQAFAPEQPELTSYQKRVQAFQSLGQYLDQEATEDHKRGGKGLPITTRIGKELVDLGLESEKRAERLESELAQLKDAMKRQQNPAFQGLERAAFIMEGMVDEGLAQMYGETKDSKPIRAAQFNAVTTRINDEIKDLMKNDPEALLKVQRNPKIMRNMVNHFMAEMLPPKVREKMDEERIKNEPMDSRAMWSALAEARDNYQEAQAKGDERATNHWSNLITDIRRDILANQLVNRRGGGIDKPSLNQLMSSVVGGR